MVRRGREITFGRLSAGSGILARGALLVEFARPETQQRPALDDLEGVGKSGLVTGCSLVSESIRRRFDGQSWQDIKST